LAVFLHCLLAASFLYFSGLSRAAIWGNQGAAIPIQKPAPQEEILKTSSKEKEKQFRSHNCGAAAPDVCGSARLMLLCLELVQNSSCGARSGWVSGA